MATTKNINMKSFNGTDYDTLYPATQTSQVLGNWDLTKVSGLLSTTFGGTGVNSLDELALNLGLNNQYAQVATGEYTGTGTYGINNKSSLTFDFYPNFVWITPKFNTSPTFGSGYVKYYIGQTETTGNYQLYTEQKTLYWCDSSADSQLNTSNQSYLYVAFGTRILSSFERLITAVGSSTIELPVTGDYYLELHGGGGGAGGYADLSGGGSGQVYNSVRLTAGVYNINIGRGGFSNYGQSAPAITKGGSTTFGDYTVEGGNVRDGYTSVAGVGNVGGASVQINQPSDVANNGGGLYPYYGSGGGVGYYTGTGSWTSLATSGAVYIKYLPPQ